MLLRSCRAAFLLRTPAHTCSSRLLHTSRALCATKAVPIQQRRDEAIRARFIRVVQDSDHESLGPVTTRDKALRDIDRTKNWLMLVDEQELEPEEAAAFGLSRSTKVGICRVVNKKEQFQKSKERTIAAKEKKQSNKKEEKEIQLTWGVALNDLHHKLKRAQQTLEKGGRTSIVITSPKGSKAPQQDDRRMFADMIKDQLGLNAGKATVWKADEWKGSKTAVFLEGVKHAT